MGDKTLGEKLLPGLSAVLIGLLLAAAGAHYFVGHSGRMALQTDVQLQAQSTLAQRTVAAATTAAAQGSTAAFDGLEALGEEIGREARDPAGLQASARKAVDDARDEVIAQIDVLVGSREAPESVRAEFNAAQQIIPQLLAQLGDVIGLASPAERAALVPHVERFEVAVQRIQQDMRALAAGVDNLPHVAQRLTAGDDYLGQVVRGLNGEDTGLGIAAPGGSAAVAELEEVTALYGRLSDSVRNAVGASDKLIFLNNTADRLIRGGQAWYGASQRALSGYAEPDVVMEYLPIALVGLALLTFLGILGLHRGAVDARRLAERQASQNERNQQAILRLLDELGSLADGDLTVQATVTEDITGAIADSINYAVEALRGLVTTIDHSAIQIDAAARQTQASASHLAKASDNQSKQVRSATDSIAKMAASIEEVSGNAERSSDVARHSVDVAHKGGDAVRRTIEGMNAIRETIQETSKRIKRLGESSQEIGNIVELINDIAEQTNILALNASIQASMAGEAGRGFAVVADEVQRLAEKSANATKQIEVLVRTIQSDTNEAVVSMERSTTDVVSGALLAENAGASLDEIEKVSNQIASLVQNISNTARQQATAAAGMTRNMGVLQEISAQTAESTSATSDAISKLAELASEQRTSVAGFTLPDADADVDVDADSEMDDDDLTAHLQEEDDDSDVAELPVPPAASAGAV